MWPQVRGEAVEGGEGGDGEVVFLALFKGERRGGSKGERKGGGEKGKK